jgi:hypothetical protein
MSDTMDDQPIKKARWDYLVALDEELLQGDVMMSEYAVELLRNADVCYVSGAFVAGIVMAAAAVETWLRGELNPGGKKTFFDLIGQCGLSPAVIDEVHTLRKMRNGWVHVGDPSDDERLLEEFEKGHPKLETECRAAMRIVRRVLYSCQGV